MTGSLTVVIRFALALRRIMTKFFATVTLVLLKSRDGGSRPEVFPFAA